MIITLGDAIWNLALKDTWKYLHFKFDRTDHALWEKDILRIGTLWKGCTRVQTDRRDCREELFGDLHKYMKRFQWYVGENDRRFYAPIRVAYQAMELLMLKALAEHPLVDTRKDIVDWYDTIEEEYLESMKYFVDFQSRSGCERVIDLSPVTVCQKKQVLWQEFEQPACETRWKKSMNSKKKLAVKRNTDLELDDAGEESDENEISGDENKDDDAEDDMDEQLEEEKFYEMFKPDFTKVQQIGGLTSDFRTIMQAKFTDFGGKKTIPIARKIVDLHKVSKGEVIEELIDTAYDKREAYEEKVKKELGRFTKQTFGKMERAAEIFHRQLKQFLRNSRLQTV